MRRGVPPHVRVAPDAAHAEALEREVHDVAETAGVDDALHLAHQRVVEEGLVDEEHAARGRGGVDQLAAVGRGERERLLDPDVLARRGAPPAPSRDGATAASAITIASTSSRASSAAKSSVQRRPGCSARAAASRSGSRSQRVVTRAPESRPKVRSRFLPQYPTPTMAMLGCCASHAESSSRGTRRARARPRSGSTLWPMAAAMRRGRSASEPRRRQPSAASATAIERPREDDRGRGADGRRRVPRRAAGARAAAARTDRERRRRRATARSATLPEPRGRSCVSISATRAGIDAEDRGQEAVHAARQLRAGDQPRGDRPSGRSRSRRPARRWRARSAGWRPTTAARGATNASSRCAPPAAHRVVALVEPREQRRDVVRDRSGRRRRA